MILVDTNVISEALRPSGDRQAIDWLDAQLLETLFLSAITVAELRFGIASMPPGKRRDGMHSQLESRVLPLFAGRLVAFDVEVSASYAKLMAEAKEKGKAISRADGYIAATAAFHGLAVATRDTSPFLAAGLEVINPWESA